MSLLKGLGMFLDAASGLPQQVGEPTPVALAHRATLLAVIGFQGFMGIMALGKLFDIVSALSMFGQVYLGYLGWKHYMHITYICVWGLVCMGVGCMQLLGEVLPILFSVLTFKLTAVLVRVLLPVSSFFGAAFAWHLYMDYKNQKSIYGFDVDDKTGAPLGKGFSSLGAAAIAAQAHGTFGHGGPAVRWNPDKAHSTITSVKDNPFLTA
eukprot:TRINITY_DN15889_c0_g1_i2.p1 TRINITY_DN15889_c0_g1~~TRINITY_DN15889_c0_g1_i2.p1  ORF type:complete len:241 (+),score=53.93 TRINITY_DN15889_c0_g1_i2:98-724(+)